MFRRKETIVPAGHNNIIMHDPVLLCCVDNLSRFQREGEIPYKPFLTATHQKNFPPKEKKCRKKGKKE
jgi:hypothetical protein